jgi:predicted ATPase with chaperone activity
MSSLTTGERVHPAAATNFPHHVLAMPAMTSGYAITKAGRARRQPLSRGHAGVRQLRHR